MKLGIFAATQGIILLTIVVLLEVSFQPLAELKVVEVLGLDELADVNVTLDTVAVECLLQHLVVLHELVLVFGSPLDTAEWEGTRVERVQHGAVNRTCRALLNLSELQLYKNALAKRGVSSRARDWSVI